MKKIAVIEDDQSLQQMLSEALSGEFKVVQAYDGESGLKAILETKPDLVVLDLVLPKKSGFQVLREFRGMAEFENIPVIALTNIEGKAEIERAVSLGVKVYLIKSYYTLKEIVEIIRKYLYEH